jgi:hypothetical protein
MKKLFLSACLGLIGLVGVNAQEGLKAEVTVGATIGDASDVFGINYGAAASYLYPVMEDLHVGAKVGLDIFSGKDIMNTNVKLKNMTLIPITASAQYDIMDQFFAGVDLGYALSLNNDYNGGFYFMPKGGWQNEFIQVFAYLKGISSKIDKGLNPVNDIDPKFNNTMGLGVGFAYKF